MKSKETKGDNFEYFDPYDNDSSLLAYLDIYVIEKQNNKYQRMQIWKLLRPIRVPGKVKVGALDFAFYLLPKALRQGPWYEKD